MVLENILERSRTVVVASAAFETERLLPEDLHLCRVPAVPDRTEHSVSAEREQVLRRGHAEHVVDSEDRLLPLVADHPLPRAG